METSNTDSLLNQILSKIKQCEDDKRKTQREIEYYASEIDRLNREIVGKRRELDKPTYELAYHRKEMTELDRKFSTLHASEASRRRELENEQKPKR